MSVLAVAMVAFPRPACTQTAPLFQTPGVTLNPTPVAGTSYGAIVSADFNNDGKPDLAAVENNLYILLNQGTGDKSLDSVTHTYPLPPAGAMFSSIAAADVNSDGKEDLIILGSDYASGLLVLLGNGDGTFQPPIATPFYLVQGRCGMLATGDFNGDQLLECKLWTARHVCAGFSTNVSPNSESVR